MLGLGGEKATEGDNVIRRLKRAAAVAAGTLVAAASLAASADAVTFTAGASSGTVQTTQTSEILITLPGVFPSTAKGELKCPTVKEQGTYASATFAEIEVTATFSGCTFLGFLNGVIQMNGCVFKYRAGTASASAMEIICPAGKEIDLVVGNGFCVVHIGPQIRGNVSYKNNTTAVPDDVERTLAVTGLGYRATYGCTEGGLIGNYFNGSITGTSTMRAFNSSGTQVNLTVD
jgi:hypothetical protein